MPNKKWGVGYDLYGQDYRSFVTYRKQCYKTCRRERKCTHFTFVGRNRGRCYLKKGYRSRKTATFKNNNKFFSAILRKPRCN